MKNSLLMMSALAIVMSACTSNEEESILQNQEITFQVANFQSLTKALDNNQLSYPTTVPFGTYAWYYQDQTNTHTTTAQPFMNDQEITFQTPNWKANGKTYYWPKTGSIDFISYSPFSTEYYTKEIVADKIKFSGNINQTDDLMYADKAINKNANGSKYYYSGVPTLFHHALAKLNFKVQQKKMSKGSDDDVTTWEITVKDITIGKLASEGSVTLNLADDKTTWTLPETKVWTNKEFEDLNNWTDDTKVVSKLDEDITIVGQLLTDKAVDFTGAQNYFVLPQTLTEDGQYFTVTYDIVTKNAGDKVIVENNVQKTANFNITGLSLKAWEMNKNITYTIVIDPAGQIVEITFDPAVQDWTTDQKNKEVVIH